MQVVFLHECKSYENSNQIFFSVMLSVLKTKDILVMAWKMKLFSGAKRISVSNEQGEYLDPHKTSTRELFCKNSQRL